MIIDKRMLKSLKRRQMRWMITLSFIFYHLFVCKVSAQIGTWNAYLSYYNVQQIVKGGNCIYVRASNALYSYNLTDQSIVTYDKVRQLSDNDIRMIGWNNQTKKLVIVYENNNIDLLSENDEVTNLSAYYFKTMTENKTVNALYMHQQFAYLCTGFGLIKINLQRNEFSESYFLSKSIQAMGISGNNIYAQATDGTVLTANTSDNLINPASWSATTTVPTGIFITSTADWDTYYPIVQTLKPGGPRYNNFDLMRFKHNRLYTVGGGYSAVIEGSLPGTPQLLDADGNWIFLQDNMKGVDGTEKSDWSFIDSNDIDADPDDPNHIWVSGRTGLYEYKDTTLVKYYHKDNSLLYTVTSSNKYVLVETVTCAPDKTVWLSQSQTANSLISISPDGTWTAYDVPELMEEGKSHRALRRMMVDSRGLIWLVNDDWTTPAIYCFDPESKKIVNEFSKKLTNQDGTSYDKFFPHCITEDLDGNMWVGTDVGVFMIEAPNVTTANQPITQVKVPRNDGSDLADYLMANTVVKVIAIDGANRKWIGTDGNGLYLISADNNEQIHHFTTENSPLLDNVILSLAINPTTGEVYIGTDKGLCSYMSDATEAAEEPSEGDLYVYPNPVTPQYKGLITIHGLTFNSHVKIVSASGKLISEGYSNGGTFTWDGCDNKGRRVASGVYIVVAATQNGKKASISKIAIVN